MINLKIDKALKNLLLLIFVLMLIPYTHGAGNVSTDKATYNPGTAISISGYVTTAGEKSSPYNFTLTNETGVYLAHFTGTTPATVGQVFVQVYTIPTTYTGKINISLYVSGVFKSMLQVNVSGASAGTLLIYDSVLGGGSLGTSTSIRAKVTDNTGAYKISGAVCNIEVLSNNQNQTIFTYPANSVDGIVSGSWIMSYTQFQESTAYYARLSCYCGGTNGSDKPCIGVATGSAPTIISNSVGTTTIGFTTNQYITFHDETYPLLYPNKSKVYNLTLTAGFDDLYLLRNTTNNFGKILESDARGYFTNNDTGTTYGGELVSITTYNVGNDTKDFRFRIPKDAPTGVYKFVWFYTISYEDVQVAQYIKETDTFNVTSLQDTVHILSVFPRDVWGNNITVNTSTQGISTLPPVNYTNRQYTLTEGFKYELCTTFNNTYRNPYTNKTDIITFATNLRLINPTTSKNLLLSTNYWISQAGGGNITLCYSGVLPDGIPTHSDYQLQAVAYVSDTPSAPFICGILCEFQINTTYFYIGAIEDKINQSTWIAYPNTTSDGVAGVIIQTQNGSYLPMLDNCNYTKQAEIPWGTVTNCTHRINGSTLRVNYTSYPKAGERIKVCGQIKSYITNTIMVGLDELYMRQESTGTQHNLLTKPMSFLLYSTMDNYTYSASNPSQAQDFGGKLQEGYSFFCTDWLDIPYQINGGNDWVIYGVLSLDKDFYNLVYTPSWTFKSPQFPLYGKVEGGEYIVINGVLTDKQSYYVGENMYVCANVTSYLDTRVEYTVGYRFRCTENNSNSDTSLVLLGSYSDERAHSPRTSRYQCGVFRIPFADNLKYRTNHCTVTVTIISPFIDALDNKISVPSTENISITDAGLYPSFEKNPTYPTINVYPDWRRIDDLVDSVPMSYYVAKVNITHLNHSVLDTNGSIGTSDWGLYVVFNSEMQGLGEIYNYSVTLANGSNTLRGLESKVLYTEKDNIKKEEETIGIEDINLSLTDDDYFEVRVYFEDFIEKQTNSLLGINTSLYNITNSSVRSAEALEGIENKTGTFHFSVDCPDIGYIDENMDCSITAQVEDTQIVQKEVDFTCFIEDGEHRYSEVNFNQMVNNTRMNITQTFWIPLSLIKSTQYRLFCEAGYYNLGSRVDTFYDSFTPKDRAGGIYTVGVSWGEKEIVKGVPNTYLYCLILLVFILLMWVSWKRKPKKTPTSC